MKYWIQSLRTLRFYIPHLVALAAAIFAGAAMAYATLLSKPAAEASNDRWLLPRWNPIVAGARREELANLPIWAEEPGKRRNVVAAAPAGPPWRFVGTVRDGGKVLAVIELDQGRRVQRLSAGDALPNGAHIATIAAGELSYTQENEQKTLTLFGPAKDQNFPGSAKKN